MNTKTKIILAALGGIAIGFGLAKWQAKRELAELTAGTTAEEMAEAIVVAAEGEAAAK